MAVSCNLVGERFRAGRRVVGQPMSCLDTIKVVDVGGAPSALVLLKVSDF